MTTVCLRPHVVDQMWNLLTRFIEGHLRDDRAEDVCAFLSHEDDDDVDRHRVRIVITNAQRGLRDLETMETFLQNVIRRYADVCA